MLSKLHIRNFALIEAVELDFSDGFTVFTGETGSGKSIILGALNLILGERADYSVIRNKNAKTVVEAHFHLNEKKYFNFFKEQDLDYSDETIIRREISAAGKSRAFINDTPVDLATLNALSSQLVKIHSQYHTYALKSKKFQMQLIDELAQVALEEYQKSFKDWKKLQLRIQELEEQLNQSLKDADYIQFQLEELEQLQLFDTDFEAIEMQLSQLENATEIIQQLVAVDTALDGEYGVLTSLNSLYTQLNRSRNLHPKIEELADRVHSTIVELKDIGDEATESGSSISIDEETQTILAGKLDLYNRQLKKHNVLTQSELKAIAESYRNFSTSTENLEQELAEAKNTYQKLSTTLWEVAAKIHAHRMEKKSAIEEAIVFHLEQLKLNGARVEIRLHKTEELTETGCSSVELYFTSNKGSEPKPIDKAASGGELSRLMLTLERLLSEKTELATLILDEIDTGVSGEVALKMGQMLGEMGTNMQLFSITHLPQVAAKGKEHFKVYKAEENNQTLTFVKKLNEQERLNEIAGLMSGETINEAAIENAKILMQ